MKVSKNVCADHERSIVEALIRYGIPQRMHGSIVRYILYGIPPGDFLQAVISNDLREAIGRADDVNIAILPAYVRFFYNEVDGACWGSKERMDAWEKRRGQVGYTQEDKEAK